MTRTQQYEAAARKDYEAAARKEIKTLGFPKLLEAYRYQVLGVAENGGDEVIEALMLKEILDRYAKACDNKK